MNLRTPLLFLVTVALSLSGQMLAKIGATAVMKGVSPELGNFVARLPQLLLSPYVIGGLTLCALGMVSWMYVLSQYEISRALPILGALAYITNFIVGTVYLKEQASWINFVGILLIIGGLYLVTLKSA
jgi:multidrug transporter EmrE-like cation transporter